MKCRNTKKFWLSASAMFVVYVALIVLLPFLIVDIVFSGIAGWVIGGWIHKLAVKYSEEEAKEDLHVV